MTEDNMKMKCRGCGSSLEYSAKDQSSKCPYCGTVTVIPVAEDELPDNPSAILPLTVELTELTDAVYEHLASGDMTPDQLLEHATFTKKERFYTPAYGFRGDFEAKWTASFGYNRREEYTAYETRTENGQSYRVPVTKTRTVTDWRPVSGTDTGAFAVLAYAGKQLLETTTGAVSLVEKQPDGEVVPFNPSYTTGIPVEPYAASADDAYRDRADSQVNQIIDRSVHQHAQGDRQKDWHWTATINKDSFTMLVPLCHAVYEYQGASYHVWLSGTNASRLAADQLPVDVNRKRAVKYGFLPILAAAVASGFAVFSLGYNAITPVCVVLAAILYGFLRRRSIINHSKDVRQFLLANRRAAAANTAAMTATEQGALVRDTARPGKPWLAHTAHDYILIPLVTLIVAAVPFAEIAFAPRPYNPDAAATQAETQAPTPAPTQTSTQASTSREDTALAANMPPTRKVTTAVRSVAPSEQPPADTPSDHTEASAAVPQPQVRKIHHKPAVLSDAVSPQPPNGGAAPVAITPVSARTPGLSGDWYGDYTQQDTNQVTKVSLRVVEGSPNLLTGTLVFGSGGSNAASCALSGVYNSQNKFMLLVVGNCQGSPPAYLQGKIGFSSVEPTDRQIFGVDSVHNGLLNISR